jgi:hypothetical protein
MPVSNQLTEERKMELLRQVRQHRADTLFAKGRVRAADPAKAPIPEDKVFVWVNKNEHRQVHYISSGYTVCKDVRVTTNWAQPDGTHVYGDMVLMECPKDLYMAMKLDNEYRALEGVEGEELFKAFAERAGIPVSTPKN